MTEDATGRTTDPRSSRSLAVEVGRFVLFACVTVLAAWFAATGRVAYMLTMLVIGAALGYAVIDCVGYELVRKRDPR